MYVYTVGIRTNIAFQFASISKIEKNPATRSVGRI